VAKNTLLYLFFLQRKETKENRRCAGRFTLPGFVPPGWLKVRLTTGCHFMNALRKTEANKNFVLLALHVKLLALCYPLKLACYYVPIFNKGE